MNQITKEQLKQYFKQIKVVVSNLRDGREEISE